MKDQSKIKSYATQMVKLYAEYDRPKLLPFLRGSVQYNLDAALEEVKVRQFKPELVFLLGKLVFLTFCHKIYLGNPISFLYVLSVKSQKNCHLTFKMLFDLKNFVTDNRNRYLFVTGRTGDMKTALQIIVDELCDVDQAIEFCKEHNDQELWEDLIEHSLDQPSMYNIIVFPGVLRYFECSILYQIPSNCNIRVNIGSVPGSRSDLISNKLFRQILENILETTRPRAYKVREYHLLTNLY